MNRTIDNIKLAFGIAGCFIALGFVASGFWWLFEMITGYTDALVRMAGY